MGEEQSGKTVTVAAWRKKKIEGELRALWGSPVHFYPSFFQLGHLSLTQQ